MSVDQKFLDMARDLANSRFPLSKFGATAPVFEEESAATDTPLIPGLDAYRTMARELMTKPKRKLPFMDMAEEFSGGNRAERLLRNYNRPSFYEQTETYGQERVRAVGALETPKVELRAPFSEAEFQGALYAIYRQIFGNTYVMESERPTIAESQLRNGELTVRGFIRTLVKTEVFKTRFFYKASQNRAIELSHKLLLGRAPYDQAEIARHLDLYENQGYDAEMDSYLDSEEYLENFGEGTVPYFRGFKYQVGQTGPAFSRMLDLYDGFAGSDTDRAQIGQVARLTEDLSKFVKQETPPQKQVVSLPAYSAYIRSQYALSSLQASRVKAASETPKVELRAPFSEAELQGALYAIYKQIFGNTHVMESERPTFAESQLRNGELTVRGFIRCLVKTEVFKTRFFYKASQNRAIELSHKLLLGRAPYDQTEISGHLDLYQSQGYDAEMDSYLDSKEYLENFGEGTVPYFRGFDYQVGQTGPAFSRMLDLYDGYATSDSDRAQIGQVARLTEDLSKLLKQETPTPQKISGFYGISGISPTYSPSAAYIRSQYALSSLQASRVKAASETPKVELRAPFSEAELQGALYAIYRQIFGNTHVMESERPTFAESQLRNGELTVRGFIRCLVKTEVFKTRFFYKASQNRSIELSHKLLLGRAPYDQTEISGHLDLYQSQGYDAEMDSYFDSKEYLENFGEGTVPYFRGFDYQVGQTGPAFSRMLDLYDGYATSDSDRAQIGQVARLTEDLSKLLKQENLAPKQISEIAPASSPSAAYIRPALPALQVGSRIRAASDKVELRAPFSEAELQSALYAIYKQVFGNTHVMESERPTFAESQLRDGQITVRGFIGYLVKTQAFKTRFFSKASQNRFIELNFKLLLGRAPYSQQEISHHVALYNTHGYDAEMDSYLNSAEYLENFGENIVPYYRGFDTQKGQNTDAFNRMVQLYDGYATSDSDRAQIGQVARLTGNLAQTVY